MRLRRKCLDICATGNIYGLLTAYVFCGCNRKVVIFLTLVVSVVAVYIITMQPLLRNRVCDVFGVSSMNSNLVTFLTLVEHLGFWWIASSHVGGNMIRFV